MPSLYENTMTFYIKPGAVAAFPASSGPRINSLCLLRYSSVYRVIDIKKVVSLYN